MARYSDDMPSWYIDAKELWKMLIQRREQNKELSCAFTMNVGINQAVGLMNSLPSVDVVKVVRCKDCKHFVAPQGVPCCNNFYGLGFPQRNGDDFCSYGERRTKDGK